MMFGFEKRKAAVLEQRCETLEERITGLMQIKDRLEDENAELRSENKKLSTKRKIEEEQIAHKLKMREETVDLEYQKKVQEVEAKADKKVADTQHEYRDKIEKQLEKRGDELKSMYNEILKHLSPVAAAAAKAEAKRKD